MEKLYFYTKGICFNANPLGRGKTRIPLEKKDANFPTAEIMHKYL